MRSIAAAYAETGNYELAEDHYRMATDIAPEEARHRQKYALFLLETEQFEAAMDVLELAEESSVGPELSYCRIACLFEVGDRQEALLQLSEVLGRGLRYVLFTLQNCATTAKRFRNRFPIEAIL